MYYLFSKMEKHYIKHDPLFDKHIWDNNLLTFKTATQSTFDSVAPANIDFKAKSPQS